MSIFRNPLQDAVFFLIVTSLMLIVIFTVISIIRVKFPDLRFNRSNRRNKERSRKRKTEVNKTSECLKCGDQTDTQQIYCSKCNRDFIMRKYYPHNIY
jgi:hypothetical protein